MVKIGKPEGNLILGAITEDELINFFTKFCGWRLIYRNVDQEIIKGPRKKDKGIDILLSCYNPYTDKKEGVLVESKRKKEEKYLKISDFRKTLYSLKENIENFPKMRSWSEDTFIQKNIDDFFYGILAFRFDNYELFKEYDIYKKISITDSKMRGIPVIFTLTNDRLSRFHYFSLIEENRDCKFIYPMGYLENKKELRERFLSINYLFSDIILGENKEGEFILYFGYPEYRDFSLIYDISITFQLRNLRKLYFCYGDHRDNHLYKQRLKNFNFQKDLIFELLNQDYHLKTDLTKAF